MISRLTTKEILGESLLELGTKKPLEKIMVREIVENCGYSSATFYRHFHDKYELSAWIYNNQMEKLFRQYETGKLGWREVCHGLVDILEKNLAFYQNVLKKPDADNSFFRSGHERCKELIRQHVIRVSGKEPDPEKALKKGASHSGKKHRR